MVLIISWFDPRNIDKSNRGRIVSLVTKSCWINVLTLLVCSTEIFKTFKCLCTYTMLVPTLLNLLYSWVILLSSHFCHLFMLQDTSNVKHVPERELWLFSTLNLNPDIEYATSRKLEIIVVERQNKKVANIIFYNV